MFKNHVWLECFGVQILWPCSVLGTYEIQVETEKEQCLSDPMKSVMSKKQTNTKI